MSLMSRPRVASVAAITLQHLGSLARRAGQGPEATAPEKFPELPRSTRRLTIPTSVAPARAVAYLPLDQDHLPGVHVNFHGGGFVMASTDLDDPLCRYLAAQAGVVVLNVDYVVAPQHRFPAPPRQAFDVVRWVAEHGAEHGWDGERLSVGGQSAGGSLAAAAARQALEQDGPSIALQALHYPALDLTTPARDKRAAIDKPLLRPWLAEMFDTAYIPDPRERADRLASPAGREDTANLAGIAPALVITAEYDRLREEGRRYAERLQASGALVEHIDVPGVDHGYDNWDEETARTVYAVIARHVRRATSSTSLP